MGAPAITYFCENGHIVLDVPHGYEKDEPINCAFCETRNIRQLVEWQDPDYVGRCSLVSYTPLRTEEYLIHIPVYDVSKLFKED